MRTTTQSPPTSPPSRGRAVSNPIRPQHATPTTRVRVPRTPHTPTAAAATPNNGSTPTRHAQPPTPHRPLSGNVDQKNVRSPQSPPISQMSVLHGNTPAPPPPTALPTPLPSPPASPPRASRLLIDESEEVCSADKYGCVNDGSSSTDQPISPSTPSTLHPRAPPPTATTRSMTVLNLDIEPDCVPACQTLKTPPDTAALLMNAGQQQSSNPNNGSNQINAVVHDSVPAISNGLFAGTAGSSEAASSSTRGALWQPGTALTPLPANPLPILHHPSTLGMTGGGVQSSQQPGSTGIFPPTIVAAPAVRRPPATPTSVQLVPLNDGYAGNTNNPLVSSLSVSSMSSGVSSTYSLCGTREATRDGLSSSRRHRGRVDSRTSTSAGGERRSKSSITIGEKSRRGRRQMSPSSMNPLEALPRGSPSSSSPPPSSIGFTRLPPRIDGNQLQLSMDGGRASVDTPPPVLSSSAMFCSADGMMHSARTYLSSDAPPSPQSAQLSPRGFARRGWGAGAPADSSYASHTPSPPPIQLSRRISAPNNVPPLRVWRLREAEALAAQNEEDANTPPPMYETSEFTHSDWGWKWGSGGSEPPSSPGSPPSPAGEEGIAFTGEQFGADGVPEYVQVWVQPQPQPQPQHAYFSANLVTPQQVMQQFVYVEGHPGHAQVPQMRMSPQPVYQIHRPGVDVRTPVVAVEPQQRIVERVVATPPPEGMHTIMTRPVDAPHPPHPNCRCFPCRSHQYQNQVAAIQDFNNRNMAAAAAAVPHVRATPAPPAPTPAPGAMPAPPIAVPRAVRAGVGFADGGSPMAPPKHPQAPPPPTPACGHPGGHPRSPSPGPGGVRRVSNPVTIVVRPSSHPNHGIPIVPLQPQSTPATPHTPQTPVTTSRAFSPIRSTSPLSFADSQGPMALIPLQGVPSSRSATPPSKPGKFQRFKKAVMKKLSGMKRSKGSNKRRRASSPITSGPNTPTSRAPSPPRFHPQVPQGPPAPLGFPNSNLAGGIPPHTPVLTTPYPHRAPMPMYYAHSPQVGQPMQVRPVGPQYVRQPGVWGRTGSAGEIEGAFQQIPVWRRGEQNAAGGAGVQWAEVPASEGSSDESVGHPTSPFGYATGGRPTGLGQVVSNPLQFGTAPPGAPLPVVAEHERDTFEKIPLPTLVDNPTYVPGVHDLDESDGDDDVRDTAGIFSDDDEGSMRVYAPISAAIARALNPHWSPMDSTPSMDDAAAVQHPQVRRNGVGAQTSRLHPRLAVSAI